MSDAYAHADADVVASWSRTHQNDEETHVAVLDLGESFLVLAVDLGVEGDVIASEVAATSLTEQEAEQRAQRWLDENPKGIKGDGALAGLLG
jgi:hypothetical protein